MRVLIAVTHLLGAGHLTRAATLARAFASAGHEVTLVSGGMPSSLIQHDGAAFVQLPPVRTAGTDFRTLLDKAGHIAGEELLAERRQGLLQTFHSTVPDLILTELFPFGRRALADEFLALLEEAHRRQPKPIIACSIRDILVAPSRPERIAVAHERLTRFYDAVFVHGDPELVALEESWPVDESIRPLLQATGYVDEGGALNVDRSGTIRNGILVSGGSSLAALPLYRAAVAAARLIPEKPWRLLVGRGLAETDVEALAAEAPPHMQVERARPDFRQLLAGAEVSVSQAGYNTVVDLLRTGPVCVLVPFEAGHETEQRLRAERLKAKGMAQVLLEDALSPDRLAAAICEALDKGISSPSGIAIDGAARTVALAEELVLNRVAPTSRPSLDWSPFEEALRRARGEGCSLSFWWRDDDAVAQTPALERLLALRDSLDAGLGLAVIPADLETSLVQRLEAEPDIHVLVHGLTHDNHAPEGEKLAEFGEHRPLAVLRADADRGFALTRAKFTSRLLPVFVPPWNRIAPTLTPILPDLGYGGLSTYNNRALSGRDPRLIEVNTHLDPIEWHRTRSLADPDSLVATLARAVLSRLDGTGDPQEPIGILTHHLVHDEAVWNFCERLLNRLSHNSIRLMPIPSVFPGLAGSQDVGKTLW